MTNKCASAACSCMHRALEVGRLLLTRGQITCSGPMSLRLLVSSCQLGLFVLLRHVPWRVAAAVPIPLLHSRMSTDSQVLRRIGFVDANAGAHAGS